MKQEVRERVFKKYSNKCAKCKKANSIINYNSSCLGNGFKEYARSRSALEIHHKDKNRRNNLTSNLILLCKKCHKKEDIKSKPMRNGQDTMVSFRVTDEEYKKIKKLADSSYRSISNWLRKKIVEDK